MYLRHTKKNKNEPGTCKLLFTYQKRRQCTDKVGGVLFEVRSNPVWRLDLFSLLDLKSGVGDFDLGNLASITVLFYFILHVPIDVPPGI